MLTLYARYNEEELRALQVHCLDFCYCQYDVPEQYNSVKCAKCLTHRVCKDLFNLAAHCETLINRRKSTHC